MSAGAEGAKRWTGASGALFCIWALLAALPAESGAQLAVQGETVYTMAGEVLEDGVVLVGPDGTIEEVGPGDRISVPDGYRVVSGSVVTPGLVDARTVVGLSGHLNIPDDQDQLDEGHAIQPELRAMDAYNARERLVEWVRNHGVTTLHTGHGPGALMSGQTMTVKAVGRSADEAVIDSVAGVAMHLGPEVSATFSPNPGTRSRGVAMIRQEFLRAQAHLDQAANDDSEARTSSDLRVEILSRVLEGEVPAYMTAHQVSEIMAALRLHREFDFPMVLVGAAEAYRVADVVADAGVPVILHPTMARHQGSLEHASFESARRLLDAGIEVALHSGYEPYVPKTRVVLFEAAPLVAHGLSVEEALATVTTHAARAIGQDHRVGSLEPGKDGDLAIFDGDPLEYVTRVCTVVIEGEVVSDECH